MFPPTPTSDPYELLNNMWLSVQRGGEAFAADAYVEPNEQGYRAQLKLTYGLGDSVRKTLGEYMRSYARASGWQMNLHFTKHHALLELKPARARSKAASSSSKNL